MFHSEAGADTCRASCSFRHLALNVVAEGIVRLGGSLLAIKLGYGVTGVIGANVAAVVMAYLLAIPTPWTKVAYHPEPISVAFREGLQAITFFVGAVIINNFDIVLVKHFFPPAEAGLYAAVALVGRVIYVLSWSAVSGMFPIAAGTRSQKRDHGVLATSLLLVLGIGFAITMGLWLAPRLDLDDAVWRPLRNGRRSPLSADALRRHHQRLFPQRRVHRLRDVAQDRQHRAGCNWLSAPS